jgi:hypothetical protein
MGAPRASWQSQGAACRQNARSDEIITECAWSDWGFPLLDHEAALPNAQLLAAKRPGLPYRPHAAQALGILQFVF